jgi:hypothetical protein
MINMKNNITTEGMYASIKSSFSFNQNNRDKGEEFIHCHDTDLFEFKSNLFKIIEDIIKYYLIPKAQYLIAS